MERLEQIMEAVSKEGGNRKRKTDFLQSQLAFLTGDSGSHERQPHSTAGKMWLYSQQIVMVTNVECQTNFGQNCKK